MHLQAMLIIFNFSTVISSLKERRVLGMFFHKVYLAGMIFYNSCSKMKKRKELISNNLSVLTIRSWSLYVAFMSMYCGQRLCILSNDQIRFEYEHLGLHKLWQQDGFDSMTACSESCTSYCGYRFTPHTVLPGSRQENLQCAESLVLERARIKDR
jgi:hypothetical protein